MTKQILLERGRLVVPPEPTQKATGIGIARFIVSCQSDAFSVLELAKEILLIVNHHSLKEWPSIESWMAILPVQFINSCSPELTDKEKIEHQKNWAQLTYNEKVENAAQEEKWTLSSWLSWLEPTEREWFWWSAVLFNEPLNDSHFVVEVTMLDSPFMSGALKWLFKACGAIDVISEDDI
ncbi:hypothetical protein SOASR032_33050 [Pragia fontium]|uniref:Uncharacterized protein n=1 Tax=Pragia fontium TaxID=82985 RepID=A0ABQ5LNZ6_9GAMM|nr:hypothetical protein [Pragia fontium]GKX64736.1 hypothetical protein SOASR032_33050 [Pragia fontium]